MNSIFLAYMYFKTIFIVICTTMNMSQCQLQKCILFDMFEIGSCQRYSSVKGSFFLTQEISFASTQREILENIPYVYDTHCVQCGQMLQLV